MVSNVSMVGFHPIWSIWTQLGFLYRVFWLVLLFVSASMLIFTARIWVRLRSRMAQREGENMSSSRCSLADLEAGLKNVCQFVSAAFYLFWLLFFIQLPYDIWTHETGRETGLLALLGTLSLNLTFGANVVLVLLVVHSVQWLVSARVLAAQRHLSE
jgi:hypothetical protein